MTTPADYLAPSPVTPAFLIISAITNSLSAVVTVTTANSYVAGQLIYFSVPFSYGMFQINGLTGQITSVDATNLILTTNVNTSQFDRFVVPSSGEQPATVSSAGARNIYNNNTVPFQSVNGQVGN